MRHPAEDVGENSSYCNEVLAYASISVRILHVRLPRLEGLLLVLHEFGEIYYSGINSGARLVK